MIFSRSCRFKETHKDALCPCRCRIEWENRRREDSKKPGPVMKPGDRWKTPRKDVAETILYPKIEPLTPRSPTFVYSQGRRFSDNLWIRAGKDSPGPNTYFVPGPFEKLRQHRLRSSDTTTFGASPRTMKLEKEKISKDVPLLNIDESFRKTQGRGTRGALILGRLNRSYETDGPGPGYYDIKRDPNQGGYAIPMRPPTKSPRSSSAPKRPSSAPGYYDVSKSLLKVTFNKNSSPITDTCIHAGSHDYCCRNCCVLCKRGVRAPVSARRP